MKLFVALFCVLLCIVGVKITCHNILSILRHVHARACDVSLSTLQPTLLDWGIALSVGILVSHPRRCVRYTLSARMIMMILKGFCTLGLALVFALDARTQVR